MAEIIPYVGTFIAGFLSCLALIYAIVTITEKWADQADDEDHADEA
jgi:hypothetical protein